MKKCLQILLFTVIMLAGCSSGNEEEQVKLTVSAAASLSTVLEEITVDFEKKYPNIHVQFNFGASGALKEQIEQGAPVDVFVSASTEKFDELVARHDVKEARNIVRNELVLIVPVKERDVQTFRDLSNDTVEKIALGTPDTVPAGQYGRQALTYYDVWSTIDSKIVYAKDVRQVLTYVETK
ncbi:MAG: molybdate ABC transporter substrate-binding protein, partial [Lysinibacillus sp.]